MRREVLRATAFAAWKNGLAALQIFQFLVNAFGDNSPSICVVYRWIKKFKDGWKDFRDAPIPGRPRSARSEKNIALIREEIEGNPYVTIRQLSLMYGLSKGTIGLILHEDLRVRKVAAKWVPH